MSYRQQRLRRIKIVLIAGIVALALCVACYGGIFYGRWKVMDLIDPYHNSNLSVSIDEMEAACDLIIDVAKEDGISWSEMWSDLQETGYRAQILLLYIALKLRIPLMIIGLVLLVLALYLNRQEAIFDGRKAMPHGDPRRLKLAKIVFIVGIAVLAICAICYAGIISRKQNLQIGIKIPYPFSGLVDLSGYDGDAEKISVSDMEDRYDRKISEAREKGQSWTEALAQEDANNTKEYLLYIALKVRIPLLILGLVLRAAALLLRLWAAAAYRTVQPPVQPVSQHRCPGCGRPVVAGAVFCPNCGMRIPVEAPKVQPVPAPKPEPVAPVEKVRRCGQCGEKLMEGELYCPNCGTRFQENGPAVRPAPAPKPQPKPVDPVKEVRRCGQCGEKLMEGELYCPNCGTRFQENGPAVRPAPAPKPEPSKNIRRLVIGPKPSPAPEPKPAPEPAPAPEPKPHDMNRGVICPRCGKLHLSWQSACASCGSPLPESQASPQPRPRAERPPQVRTISCPKCGFANPDQATYCAKCRCELKRS